jgi:hypothetical protein
MVQGADSLNVLIYLLSFIYIILAHSLNVLIYLLSFIYIILFYFIDPEDGATGPQLEGILLDTADN